MLQPAVKSRTNTPPTGLRPASTSAGRPLTADLRSVWESHSETSAVLLVLHLSVCPSCFRATVLWNILLLLVVSMWHILTTAALLPKYNQCQFSERRAGRPLTSAAPLFTHHSAWRCRPNTEEKCLVCFPPQCSYCEHLWTSVISRFHYLHLLLVFSPAAQVCFTAN